jgi:hypothetical protein
LASARKRPLPKQKPRSSEPKASPAPLPEGTDDAPEIQIVMGPAGRETLAAISAEMLGVPEHADSAPELEFRMVPAGRDTLAAITADALDQDAGGVAITEKSEPRTGVRKRVTTLGYEEMPVVPRTVRTTNPGVAPPPNTIRSRTGSSSPNLVGRDTLDAIATAVLEPGAPPSSARARTQAIDVFELVTFVVRGDDLAQLSSEATRREFVADRLMHRLPISTADMIDRVDVTPWTAKGTLILRVWCKVRAPAR